VCNKKRDYKSLNTNIMESITNHIEKKCQWVNHWLGPFDLPLPIQGSTSGDCGCPLSRGGSRLCLRLRNPEVRGVEGRGSRGGRNRSWFGAAAVINPVAKGQKATDLENQQRQEVDVVPALLLFLAVGGATGGRGKAGGGRVHMPRASSAILIRPMRILAPAWSSMPRTTPNKNMPSSVICVRSPWRKSSK